MSNFIPIFELHKTITTMKTEYSYAIVKESYPELERESTLSYNKYSAKKKFALIVKGVHKDGSESIYFIDYSNKLEELHNRAKAYPSWYNYPLGLSKAMQGNISEITLV